jgi:ubiquinone/menaquinone biosynthesis C-methylase UbiE
MPELWAVASNCLLNNQYNVRTNRSFRVTKPSSSNEVAIQRDYYGRTSAHYDEMHVKTDGEHDFALAFMLSMIDFLDIHSLLDIGSGTGRALLKVRDARPQLKVVGVEPSPELRSIGHSKGLSDSQLINGDAQQLDYPNGAFDLVCEFAALHHIPDPARAVSEMLRVASKAVFISDSNNFGQGGFLSRTMKQVLWSLKLWPVADFVKTRGKGYLISEGDGLAYSYSVFSDYSQISASCKSVHILNTAPAGKNPYRSASHVALLGIK